MRAIPSLMRTGWVCCGLLVFLSPDRVLAQATSGDAPPSPVQAGAEESAPVDPAVTTDDDTAAAASAAQGGIDEIGAPDTASVDTGTSSDADAPPPGASEPGELDLGDTTTASGDIGDGVGDTAQEESPLRFTMAYEFGYKTQHPSRIVKNRASVRVEYAKTFNGRFSVLFDAKTNAFMGRDHRREVDRTDTLVTQAYLQTSIGQTSLRAGIQTLAWGESMLAPITDEISPRDNRELFNFNLEELRIGQPMLQIDHFSHGIHLGGFLIPTPEFNKSPADGSFYDFDPLTYRHRIEGDNGMEYGVSWKKSYDAADFTLMAASLVDNDYARRMNVDGQVSRVRERFSMAGLSFTRAMGNFVLRGEAAVKYGKPFNDAALQIQHRRTIETYLGLDYQSSPTLSFSGELLNQHVSDWDDDLVGVARNRQTVMLSAEKKFLNDDLSVSVQNFRYWPHVSNLSMLLTTWTVNDNVTLSLNLAVPSTNHQNGSLRAVRDQKQVLFKIQYQF